MDVHFILGALQKRHDPWAWILVTEVPTTLLQYTWPRPQIKPRRIDAFAIALYASAHFERIAYEVKTSRADWLRELRDPSKHREAMDLSHRFFFVLAKGIGTKDDMGSECDGCGLLEVQPNQTLKTLRRAKRTQPNDIPVDFVVALLRAVRDRPMDRVDARKGE